MLTRLDGIFCQQRNLFFRAADRPHRAAVADAIDDADRSATDHDTSGFDDNDDDDAGVHDGELRPPVSHAVTPTMVRPGA